MESRRQLWKVTNAEAHVGVQAAQRAIKNRALSYLSALKDPAVTQDLLARTRAATNMTDQISALACLADSESALQAYRDFSYPVPCREKCVRDSISLTWAQ